MSKTSVTIENVTPEKAANYLAYNYEKNRPISSNKVTFYASEMKKGNWETSPPIVFASVNGEFRVLDGQHRLKAVVVSGVTLKDQVIVRKQLSTTNDFMKMFSRTDRGRNRTPGHSMHAWGVYDNDELSKTRINKVLSAIRFIESRFGEINMPEMSIETMISLTEEWLPYSYSYFSAIDNGDDSLRKRAENRAVLSVGIVTFRYVPQDAKVFWTAVAMDDMLAQYDPRKLLHKKIRETKVMGGDARGDKVETPYKIARYAALAWNHFLSKTRPQFLRVVNERAPILINGTPYNGTPYKGHGEI